MKLANYLGVFFAIIMVNSCALNNCDDSHCPDFILDCLPKTGIRNWNMQSGNVISISTEAKKFYTDNNIWPNIFEKAETAKKLQKFVFSASNHYAVCWLYSYPYGEHKEMLCNEFEFICYHKKTKAVLMSTSGPIYTVLDEKYIWR